MKLNYIGDAIIFSVLAILVVVIIGLVARHYASLSEISTDAYATTKVFISGAVVEAQIADTTAKQAEGLSYRENLPNGHGMLFVFKESGIKPFWMKGMGFSIDIIWIDKNRNIVYILPDASPSSYPRIYSPTVSAQYVLEVPAGWCADHNINAGDKVIFEM